MGLAANDATADLERLLEDNNKQIRQAVGDALKAVGRLREED